ncbi:MAG: hypothetical protein FWD71_10340 [Oscillospiraceae bacterium]|nr:hypothetical protein [Oscillospiraceae bacterium]
MIINKDTILHILNELLETEVEELIRYSENPTCNKAKQGVEAEYNYYKKRVQLIERTKSNIFFYGVFHQPHRNINLRRKIKEQKF